MDEHLRDAADARMQLPVLLILSAEIVAVLLPLLQLRDGDIISDGKGVGGGSGGVSYQAR